MSGARPGFLQGLILMATSVTDYSEFDRQIWNEELSSFVPLRVFDAHAHLFNPIHLDTTAQGAGSAWSYADYATLREWAAALYPGREVHFLVLGTPIRGIDVAAHNDWSLNQVQQDKNSRFNRLVTPSCSLDAIRRDAGKPGVTGLKPYRFFSVTGEFAQCRIHEFLPIPQLELANELGLWITLHLSMFHGCADAENLRDLEDYTRRYPRIRWILAHCARSFTYWPIRQAVDRLRDMPNLWYDVSAVTDVRPLITLFTREDRRRILYGSDGVDATYFRGQYAAMGRAWQAIDVGRQELRFPHCDGRPILAIYEQLLAMKHAAEIAQWSADDVEDIFWRNAARLFDIRFEHASITEQTSHTVDGTSTTQMLYERAKQLIPGGTQLLSKRPEMFAPNVWPAYAREARGCVVMDLDGRQLIDMTTSGIGSCLLGYCDPDVTDAVQRRISRGSMSTLNAAEEVELAELLLELHPWAEQARFARCGGESMSIAVRIARAATGRDRIAFCGYHGWSDWYLAANLNAGDDSLRGHLLPGLAPAGVPKGLAGTALPFAYNQIHELERIVATHGRDLAAIVMEPTRSADPAPGFLEQVRELSHRSGAVLIFDEISSGWRMHVGGVHMKYGTEPDLAVFAKAISNGHPMAAIIGRRKFMDAVQTSFISSTYWTEAVGPTAALATIRKLQKIGIAEHTRQMGELMRTSWETLGRTAGVPVRTGGHSALLQMSFDHPDAAALMTYYTIRMLDHGFLCGSGFYPSFAHRPHHVSQWLESAQIVFPELATIVADGSIHRELAERNSSTRHSGFARLT